MSDKQGRLFETSVPAPDSEGVVFTIGHSTRSTGEFLDLLKAHGIRRVGDVRTIPRSRRNPQFNSDSLPETLAAAGIAYTHLAGLGGLRHPKSDSVNQGWRNDSFRGFADYMQTPEFEQGMSALVELARNHAVAIMCAEAVPWRCHRSLIGDALLVRGVSVKDIMSETDTRRHALTPWAQVEGTSVRYPAPQLQTISAAPGKPVAFDSF